MKNKKNLSFIIQTGDDLEPLFILDKESFPMHIKYINIHVPHNIVIERNKRRQNILCVCGFMVTLVIAISITISVVIQNTNNHQSQLLTDISERNNETAQILNNTSNRRRYISKGAVNFLQSLKEFIPCQTTCRKYSAFRFKSTCEHGRCKCRNPFYDTNTCLPVVKGCAIHKTKRLTKHIPNEKRSTFSCYTDRDTNNPDSEIHVVSMYGQTGQEKSFLQLNLANKSRRKDVILVLANFLKTEWILHASDMVKTRKVYIISNKYLEESNISMKQFNSSINVTKLYSRVGYGDDRYNGYTVDLLQTINSNIGQITSFQGAKYLSKWKINL
ncbi:unnamed protein product [Mytilus coruscus]|uniref:Uncharacterized protein n=1 Tax=Mytilus coruscus TaxID=42192 RepID=A0A6J8E3Y2_MYTCO|nr:unnamed protein product [Mytilus coruscus]